MTLYTYRCQHCGAFDAGFPIGAAPDKVGCPACSQPCSRQITAPRIGHGASGYRTAIERVEASADRPGLVTGAPPGTARKSPPITRNPLHARLPRP